MNERVKADSKDRFKISGALAKNFTVPLEMVAITTDHNTVMIIAVQNL